jgi:hypothetical protein
MELMASVAAAIAMLSIATPFSRGKSPQSAEKRFPNPPAIVIIHEFDAKRKREIRSANCGLKRSPPVRANIPNIKKI